MDQTILVVERDVRFYGSASNLIAHFTLHEAATVKMERPRVGRERVVLCMNSGETASSYGVHAVEIGPIDSDQVIRYRADHDMVQLVRV